MSSIDYLSSTPAITIMPSDSDEDAAGEFDDENENDQDIDEEITDAFQNLQDVDDVATEDGEEVRVWILSSCALGNMAC